VRFHFPNLARPKKAAKQLAKLLPQSSLASAQIAISKVLGYRDWHDLEVQHASQPATDLDDELTVEQFRGRMLEQTIALASALSIPDVRAQYLLSAVRLTGNRRASKLDHELIRTSHWRNTSLPWRGPKAPGATFTIKERGVAPRRAYVRRIERGVDAITDQSCASGCADFEASFPRVRIDDFVPVRLTLPYGWWTQADGTIVVFSRDYMPLWNVRPGRDPEQAEPWARIKFERQDFFGDMNAELNWTSEIALGAASDRFTRFGITGLPILVDVLPILVDNPGMDVRDAVLEMKRRQ
jgi:hypothetical protein